MKLEIPRYEATILLVLAVAGAGGCAGSTWKLAESRPPPIEALGSIQSGRAKVCVVRVGSNATVHPVRDNGTLVGATAATSHFCYLAEPGTHEVRVEANPTETTKLAAEVNKSYFLREDIDEVMGVPVIRLSWVENADAKSALQATKYRVLVSTPGEALPQPGAVALATKQ